MATARALRRNLNADAENYPEDIRETPTLSSRTAIRGKILLLFLGRIHTFPFGC